MKCVSGKCGSDEKLGIVVLLSVCRGGILC